MLSSNLSRIFFRAACLGGLVSGFSSGALAHPALVSGENCKYETKYEEVYDHEKDAYVEVLTLTLEENSDPKRDSQKYAKLRLPVDILPLQEGNSRVVLDEINGVNMNTFITYRKGTLRIWTADETGFEDGDLVLLKIDANLENPKSATMYDVMFGFALVLAPRSCQF